MQIAADYLREYLHPLTDYTSLNLNVMQHLSHITQLYPTILNEKFSEYLVSHLRRWLEDIVDIINENTSNAANAAAAAANAAAAAAAAAASAGAGLQQQQQPAPPVPQATLRSYEAELKLCSAIVSLLAELQSAPVKLIETVTAMLLKYERAFMLESSVAIFRTPLSMFLKRYPFETLKYLLHSDRIKEMYIYRFIIHLIKTQPAFVDIFKSDANRIFQMLKEAQLLYANGQALLAKERDAAAAAAAAAAASAAAAAAGVANGGGEANSSLQTTPPAPPQTSSSTSSDLLNKSNKIQYLAILIVYRLVKSETTSNAAQQQQQVSWIGEQPALIDALLRIWCEERFHDKHRHVDQLDYVYWKEPVYLVKIFLRFHETRLLVAEKTANISVNE